jgi:hypothetical protein
MVAARDACSKDLSAVFKHEKQLQGALLKLVQSTASPAIEATVAKVAVCLAVLCMLSSIIALISSANVVWVRGWCGCGCVSTSQAPICADVQSTIAEVVVSVLKAWHAKIMTLASKMPEKAGSAFDRSTFVAIDRKLDQRGAENILEEACTLLLAMETAAHPLYAHRGSLPSTFTFTDMYWLVLDQLKAFVRRGLHALALCKPITRGEMEAAWTHLFSKILLDVKVMARELIMRVFKGIIEHQVDKEVMLPSDKVLAPVKAQQAALEEPFKRLMDCDIMWTEVADRELSAALFRLLDGNIGTLYSAVDAASAAAGVVAFDTEGEIDV